MISEKPRRFSIHSLLHLVLFSVTCAGTVVLAEDPVPFVDQHLKTAVEDALWISDPTPTDMLGLTVLTCIDAGITDLTGLEYATNLQKLNLRMNHISDLSALSALVNLQTLNLSKNEISDLSGLSNLAGLRELDIHLNRLSDISHLSGLSSLERLILRWNQVSDISALSHTTNLRWLTLQENQVSDVLPLSGLALLEYVELYGNPIRDISPLLGMASLGLLDVRGNPYLSQKAYCSDLQAIAASHPGMILEYDPNPTSPTGVSASDGIYWDRVRITWDNICNGPNFTTYYQVSRSTSKDGPKEPASEWQTTPYYDDTNAKPGATYWYWVRKATSSQGLNAGSYSRPDPGWLLSFAGEPNTVMVDDDAPSDPGPGDPNLSDPAEDGTSEHPFDSIQEAIEAAGKGTKIVVGGGLYLERLDLQGKTVQVVAAWLVDPDVKQEPVVDGNGLGPVVTLGNDRDAACLVAGLRIRGGRAESGAAILCKGGSPTIVNCVICGNMSSSEQGSIIECRDSHAVFLNCTVSGNVTESGGAVILCVGSSTAVSNSIVWDNLAQAVAVRSGADPVVIYSNIQGHLTGIGNMDTDPLFAEPGTWLSWSELDDSNTEYLWEDGDYHLSSLRGHYCTVRDSWLAGQAHSGCIDAGDPRSDWTLEPSPNGARINLGAYGGTSQASLSD